jgi:hypothetical protein
MKLSPRVFMGVVLGGVVAATALVVVLVIGLGGGSRSSSSAPAGEQIQATAALTPRAALFGDTVTAKVEVTFDRTQYRPEDMHVLASFEPWVKIGTPVVQRETAGPVTYLRTTYVLRCLGIRCAPTNGAIRYEFKPAHVVYQRPAGDTTERLSIDAPWPALVLHSRLDASSSPTERDALAAPWRADYISLPAVTYHVSPGWLVVVFLLGGIALIAAGGVLAYRARPRRLPPPPPPPPPPAPRLAPLEQALALLVTPVGFDEDGIAARRRALELVADEVATWGGDPSVERHARRLAWSEEDPAFDDMTALAASVRAHAEETDAKEAEARAREADAQPV